VRNAVRLVLLCLLLFATASELCASIPKTRVGEIFSLAADPRPEIALQVPELRLENWCLYDESASGRLFWSKFDPEGLAEVTPEEAKKNYEDFNRAIADHYKSQNFLMRGISKLFGIHDWGQKMAKLSYDQALKTGNDSVPAGEQALQIAGKGAEQLSKTYAIAMTAGALAGVPGAPKAPGTPEPPPTRTPQSSAAAENPGGKSAQETAAESKVESEWNGPTDYSALKNPKDVTTNTKPTPRQVRQMKEANRAQNNGELRDDVTGEEMVDSAKSQSGVTPPANEAQVDHVTPQSKGGTRAFDNLKLRTRQNNRAKSDSMPDGT
jgi:hypothetical protein